MNDDHAAVAEPDLPAPPPAPDPRECCGRGCVNCIFVYYGQALGRWRAQIERHRARHAAAP